jgi:LAO/AO transport system kinase
MLKAGILEIADLLVVNKADLDGADRTVRELREMLRMGDGSAPAPAVGGTAGHRGAAHSASAPDGESNGADGDSGWEPPVVETVANTGEGVDDLVAALADHREHLVASGELDRRARARHAESVRTLLREDVRELLAEELDRRGGIDSAVDRIVARETDPYSVADEVVAPLESCVRDRRDAK